jgi:hypothetical protein
VPRTRRRNVTKRIVVRSSSRSLFRFQFPGKETVLCTHSCYILGNSEAEGPPESRPGTAEMAVEPSDRTTVQPTL